MRDPYEVLGVPRNASKEQINAAYRILARQYETDKTRLDEINQAYDAVIFNTPAGYGNSNGYYNGGYVNNYSDIRSRIDSNRLEDAQMLLDGIPSAQRDAEWNYLRGEICRRKGWLNDASRYFNTACQLDPNNQSYRDAYNNVNNSYNGGYKQERQQNNNSGSGSDCGCDACDICSGLICADCCCECMGGDLIPCC